MQYDGKLAYDEPVIELCAIDDARYIDLEDNAPLSERLGD